MRFDFGPDDIRPPLYLIDGDTDGDLPLLMAEIDGDRVEVGRYFYADGRWLSEHGSDDGFRAAVLTRDGVARLAKALDDERKRANTAALSPPTMASLSRW